MDRLAELQMFISNFSKVERVLKIAGQNRLENDVDHSYGLALTCWFLQPKIAPDLDLLEIFKLALAHDLVEIHAGDTYAFDEDKEYVQSKGQRERDALEQLKNEWKDFEEITKYSGLYMNRSSEEARFVKAVDKLLPLLMIETGEGKIHWQAKGLTLAMLREDKKSILISESVSPYYNMFIDWLDQRGNIPKE